MVSLDVAKSSPSARERLLCAAYELFSRRGIRAVGTDEVIERAGVARATLYRHFATKDDLIAALVAERFERLADKAREALEHDDPWEALAGWIRFSVQIQADDRALCEVIGSRPDLMDAAARAAGLPELADRIVKRAQRSGDVRRDLAWEDIPMIACGMGSVIYARGPAIGRWPRLIEIVLDGLRAPGSAKLPPAL